MSQKAIKKRTINDIKNSMKISVKSANNRNNTSPDRNIKTAEKSAKSLPDKSFPLNKFIALPNGLRPKSTQASSDISKSPRKSTPIKAVAIPPGTSLNDSRAQVYVIDKARGTNSDPSSSEAYNSVDYDIVNHNTLSIEKRANGGVSVVVNKPVDDRDSDRSRPYATSTPRASRRGYSSAQNSPRRDSDSNYGSVNSTDSYGSTASNGSRKRLYKKRSQSAPVSENRKPLRDTDYVIQKWSEQDQIPGLSHETEHDGIIIQRENWTNAKHGVSPIGAIHTVYRSNSVNSPSHSVDKVKPSPHLNGSSYSSELEFTDVCNVNSTYHDKSHTVSPDSSYQSQDYSRNDLSLDNFINTGAKAKNNSSQVWDNKSEIVYTHGSYENRYGTENGLKRIERSLSDFNLYKMNMDDRQRTRDMSTAGSNSYAVNGIPQSGIMIRRPGGDNIVINDMHTRVPRSDMDFYTVGRKQGTLMQSKHKFSSMPTLLTESKGDKKLMKLLKKQEKDERKRREKEEKKRAKEEKKRLKMEKRLKTKTLPRNFETSKYNFTNGHVLHTGSTSGLDKMFRRPKLSMTAVPIDIEGDDNFSLASSTPAPKMAPPPPPGPSQKTMSLYASAPDLLRIEQVYGATLRGRNKESQHRPPIPSDYGPRTVVLQRAPEGYGFVLREFPALQYLDSVDPGSVSDRAGLHGGDFILEINGENVIKASHDRVVHLIRSTGDTLAMKVVTVQPSGGRADWFNGDKSMTMPHKMKKKAAPVPPQRDPRTSISISKSEGQSISDELSAMASLDSAISGKPEDKIASIRSRTAAKRVSVIDAENIGVDGTLGRAKSTPDLFEGSKIYASPTVPDNKKSNVYAVPGVNASTSGSPVGVAVRPKASPPPPPGEDNSPKKKAPKPPANTSFESSSSTEVVTINTNKSSPYASTKVLVKSTTKSESPYESSFRPGDSAKMSEEPKDLTGYKAGHKRTPSAGALLNRENTEQSQDTNGGVTFAEDKVLDHAASFLKKHPNAKLLMTAKGQESLRKRTSIKMEPAPDYDSDSGDEKPQSPVKFRDYKQRQSVTVISVGDKNQKPSPTQSQASKRYTIHSTIPSDDKGFSIPPRPNGPAPTPPSQNRQDTQSRKSAAPTPPQDNKVTVKVEVNREPEDNFYAPKLPDSQPPSLPSTPPPDFDDKPFLREIPRAPAPPPVAPAPPPPPPPPPAPSAEDINKVKSTASADHISSKPVSQDAIAAAVAKRQERLHNQEPKIFDNKPKPVVPQMDPNQAAIIAAVARRRQQLEKQDQHSVMESIESRLQKTKKLQAAKFSLTGSKVAKTDNKNNESANKSNVQSNVKGLGSVKKPEPAKAEKEEFSFKVEPIKELPKIIKNQPGITQIKPNFGQRPVKSASETKQANGIGVNKPKPIENVIVKPAPATNKDKLSEVKNETDNEQTKSEKNVNGQSDFLALAEKRRQEWLQRKQKSSESKSSSASGSPDKERFRNGEKKGVSPQVSAKPSKPLTNGDVYANVPPPPAAFRDGGNTDNNNIVQLEIIPPPMHFSSEHGHETSSQQHSPAFSPDTASLVSSLSTLSSLSGEGRGNGYEDVIAPPPPGFDDGDTSVIPPPPQFDSLTDKKAGKSFGDKPVSDWLCNDVLDWLDSLSMSQYKSSFQRNCIDGKKLLGLSRNHYIDLGVTQVGHRMTIERSIKKAEIKQKNLSNNVIASEHL
ncbi:SHAN1-like protein [Mya arenaria]|uniref:SHAN1-like protein n=1 Tax=Mya arenaria TaxID=6604 RepID=A0ABY7EGM2_MYAAR|nr:SHAN1-like protein [Mya arenaria]